MTGWIWSSGDFIDAIWTFGVQTSKVLGHSGLLRVLQKGRIDDDHSALFPRVHYTSFVSLMFQVSNPKALGDPQIPNLQPSNLHFYRFQVLYRTFRRRGQYGNLKDPSFLLAPFPGTLVT